MPLFIKKGKVNSENQISEKEKGNAEEKEDKWVENIC